MKTDWKNLVIALGAALFAGAVIFSILDKDDFQKENAPDEPIRPGKSPEPENGDNQSDLQQPDEPNNQSVLKLKTLAMLNDKLKYYQTDGIQQIGLDACNHLERCLGIIISDLEKFDFTAQSTINDLIELFKEKSHLRISGIGEYNAKIIGKQLLNLLSEINDLENE